MESDYNTQRGYVRCMRDGMAFALKNFKSVVRHGWPALVLVIVFACVSHVLMGRSLVGFLQGDVRGVAILQLASSMLSLLGSCSVTAAIATQQNLITRSEEGLLQLPRRRNWRALAGTLLRVLLMEVMGCLLFGVLLSACRVALPHLHAQWLLGGGRVGGVLLTTLLAIVALVIGLLLASFYLLVWGNYVYGGKGVGATLKLSWWQRHQLWRTTAIVFLTSVCALAVCIVFSLPYTVLLNVKLSVAEAALGGDMLPLPGYFGSLMWLSVVVAALGTAFSLLLILYPVFYNWQSISAQPSPQSPEELP